MNQQDRQAELRRELDAEKLIQTAQQVDGFTDFGDETFREPMQKFIECVAKDIDFNDHGVDILKRDLVRHLVNRLRFQHDLKHHPEILEQTFAITTRSNAVGAGIAVLADLDDAVAANGRYATAWLADE